MLGEGTNSLVVPFEPVPGMKGRVSGHLPVSQVLYSMAKSAPFSLGRATILNNPCSCALVNTDCKSQVTRFLLQSAANKKVSQDS